MACEGRCVAVQFKVRSVRFLYIEPRPRAGAPKDLEQQLEKRVSAELEREFHDAPAGCDCVIHNPVEVESREQVKQISDGTYTAWYQVELVKFRTEGECMPEGDEPPAGH